MCYRRVGHCADQYRRARWPARRSQTFVVSYELLQIVEGTSEVQRMLIARILAGASHH